MDTIDGAGGVPRTVPDGVNLTMAASILFMVPVIVLFFLAQRVFVEGVTLTGVKG
jgi:ABC-type maltose transport system permease subunit